MKIKQKIFLATLLLSTSLSTHADVLVEAGYYDLPGGSVGGASPYPLPDPWYGSANTSFFGSTYLATDGDPDEAAVILENTGSTAVTLSQGVIIGGLTLWNSYIPAGGFTLGAGDNVIFSGTLGGYEGSNTDGSDNVFPNNKIDLMLDGKAYEFTTSALTGYPDSANETLSWTLAGAVVTSVPEPSESILLVFGLLSLVTTRSKKFLKIV